MRETAGLLVSAGCRLAAVIEASKKSTATPLGGVSPMLRVMGTPFVVIVERFVELLQASSSTQPNSESAKRKRFRMVGPPKARKWKSPPEPSRRNQIR